jgi:hypothetical protein
MNAQHVKGVLHILVDYGIMSKLTQGYGRMNAQHVKGVSQRWEIYEIIC